MVLWSFSPSVLLLFLGTVTVASTNDPLNEVRRVVQQLQGVSHLRVKMGLNVQGVDRVHIGAVSLFLGYEVQEFAGSSHGLNLLLLRNPFRQFRVGAERFGHNGMGHLSSFRSPKEQNIV